MVSRENILSRFYQIYVRDIGDGYFMYNNKMYYLSNVIPSDTIIRYYQLYLQQLGKQGYYIVKNVFGHMQSDGYILYTYEVEPYDVTAILKQSLQLIPEEYASLLAIKESWGHIVDDARKSVAKYASRLNHIEYYVVLSYYYQGIGENVISLMNEIMARYNNASLPVGFTHLVFENTYDSIYNPTNFVISTRVRDLALAYQENIIDMAMLDPLLPALSELEIMYLYLRTLFPSNFFSLVLHERKPEVMKEKLITIYQRIDHEKERNIQLYEGLQQYSYIPPIHWLFEQT